MKVFQVLNFFLPQQTAGTEIYVWALSKQLQKKGFEVKIVIPNYGKVNSEDYVYDELQVHKFAETSVADRDLIMGFKDSNGLEFFKQYIIKQKPDIIHFHEIAGSNGISLKHLLVAKSSGAKIIFTFHLAGYTCKTGTLLYNEKKFCDGEININKCSECYLHNKGYGRLKYFVNPISQLFYLLNINSTKWNSKIGTALGTSFLIKKQKIEFDFLINHCDKVITLTKWYENILLLNDVPSKKIEYIPQGLPLKTFPDSIRKSNNSIYPLRIMFLGRISFLKGLHLLIDALLQIPKEDIQLNIYGQDDGTDYKKSLVEKSKLFPNINWCGKIEQNKVIKTMQDHDILCLCSTFSEMSPIVIQEAFAADLPILASNVYGNAEQIKHNENGWLFNFKDVNSLKNQIQLLVNNPSLIENAKRNIKPGRDFEILANEQILVYEKVLSAS